MLENIEFLIVALVIAGASAFLIYSILRKGMRDAKQTTPIVKDVVHPVEVRWERIYSEHELACINHKGGLDYLIAHEIAKELQKTGCIQVKEAHSWESKDVKISARAFLYTRLIKKQKPGNSNNDPPEV